MDRKLFGEWLKTLEGLVTSVGLLLTAGSTVWGTATGTLAALARSLGLTNPWWPRGAAMLVIGAMLLLLLRSYRGFARESRIVRHEAFALHPTSPETLIGRAKDLDNLVKYVKQFRLVLMDGESGCGKSALVAAGLVPTLQASDGLLPVLIRDWGDDWIRGPLVDVLDCLYHALSPAERAHIGWTAEPDLAAATQQLATEVDTRFNGVFAILGRRPLLIADQFDDYQALHRGRFLDEDGAWLRPDVLAERNAFWELVSRRTRAEHLHVLVVTRADTAAGLSCMRFIEHSKDHTLQLVNVGLVATLLASVAPDDADPPVIADPEHGWHDLRDRLGRDLQAERAILMQQVRIVLLGLRHLPRLAPRHYAAAGGLHGMETLFISRALGSAADMVGGGERGRRLARAVLLALVQPGGADRRPTAQRAEFSRLAGIAGGAGDAAAILGKLQEEEVVRQVTAAGDDSAWRLDHDYLARAVLSENRQANRWFFALQEGMARHDEAAGNWRRRLATLLPTATLARLCWERVRNRLRFGMAAGYAWKSAAKPASAAAVLALLATAGYAWNEDRLLTAQARDVISRFASSREKEGVMRTWQGEEPLRRRIRELVAENPDSFEIATGTGWPMAHAGLDPSEATELAADYQRQLATSISRDTGSVLLVDYARLLTRRSIAKAQLRVACVTFREALERREIGTSSSKEVATGYMECARRLGGKELNEAEAYLRSSIFDLNLMPNVSHLAPRYAKAVVQRNNASEVGVAVEFFRQHLGDDYGRFARHYGTAYAILVPKLDLATVKSEAEALGARFLTEDRKSTQAGLVIAYTALALRITERDTVRKHVSNLRRCLESNRFADEELAVRWWWGKTYAAAGRQLDENDAKTEAQSLRERIEKLGNSRGAAVLWPAYAALAIRSDRQDLAEDAASTLFSWLMHVRAPGITLPISQAYAEFAARLPPKDAKAMISQLRMRLEREQHQDARSALSRAYRALVSRLDDAATVKAEVSAFRSRFGSAMREDSLALAYGAALAQLNEVDANSEAAWLGRQLAGANDDSTVTLATAYSAAANVQLKHARTRDRRAEVVREILTMGGHPYLDDPAPLLEALKPASRQDFGSDVTAAVSWAAREYGIAPADLRPRPGTGSR